jgi:hypothetical protein
MAGGHLLVTDEDRPRVAQPHAQGLSRNTTAPS